MLYIALASSVIALLALAFAASRGNPPPLEEAQRNSGPNAQGAAPSAPPEAENEDQAIVEEARGAIKGLLEVLAASMNSFLDRADAYTGQLTESANAIRNASSLDNLKSIETELLGSLDRLQRANSDYRKQLAAAREQIASQQVQLGQLEIDVRTDFLTGLPNRRALEHRLRENVDRNNRYQTKFSLAIFDIDFFKAVNDKYGHVAGDRVIQAVGALLLSALRSSDFLARYGGEEFVLILPETSDSQAVLMCERIRSSVESSKFAIPGDTIHINVSVGVGEVLKPKDTPENLFERVDAALYKAKQTGRNKVVCAI